MNGDRSTGAPTPPHSPCHCCLLANRDRCRPIVAAARRRMLFDCGLDSDSGVSGNRYRVLQSIKYRPIPNPPQYRPVLANTRYPNTSIVRTLMNAVSGLCILLCSVVVYACVPTGARAMCVLHIKKRIFIEVMVI